MHLILCWPELISTIPVLFSQSNPRSGSPISKPNYSPSANASTAVHPLESPIDDDSLTEQEDDLMEPSMPEPGEPADAKSMDAAEATSGADSESTLADKNGNDVLSDIAVDDVANAEPIALSDS